MVVAVVVIGMIMCCDCVYRPIGVTFLRSPSGDRYDDDVDVDVDVAVVEGAASAEGAPDVDEIVSDEAVRGVGTCISPSDDDDKADTCSCNGG